VIELKVEAGVEAAAALVRVKMVAADHPGDHELEVQVHRGRERVRTLRLGPLWTYSGDAACLAALGEYGDAVVTAGR
jgi:hypothetical protein